MFRSEHTDHSQAYVNIAPTGTSKRIKIFWFFWGVFFPPTCFKMTSAGSQHRSSHDATHSTEDWKFVATRSSHETLTHSLLKTWFHCPASHGSSWKTPRETWIYRSQLLSVYHMMFPLCNGARIDSHSCWRRGVLMCSPVLTCVRPRLGNNCWEFIGGLECRREGTSLFFIFLLCQQCLG